MSLTKDMIAELVDLSDPTDPKTFSIAIRARLHAMIAFFHFACTNAKFRVEFSCATKKMLDEFQLSLCNPAEEVVPWELALKKLEERRLIEWNKTHKIDRRDYPVLKNEEYALQFMEDFMNTIRTHREEHLIDPNYVPECPELHEGEQAWMFQIFKRSCPSGMPRKITHERQADKNIPLLWNNLKTHLSTSQSKETRCETLMSNVINSRIKDHKGSHKQFLLTFDENR
jgi:hypothetical protein